MFVSTSLNETQILAYDISKIVSIPLNGALHVVFVLGGEIVEDFGWSIGRDVRRDILSG